MNFALNIDLGNEAMQSTLDVADALERVAAQLRSGGGWSPGWVATLRDANGNTVGAWQVNGDASPLGDPPAELADAWQRYQTTGDVTEAEMRALDEWRADRAGDAGY